MRIPAIILAAVATTVIAKTNWKPLFDGKSFAGWHIVGDQRLWKLGVNTDPKDSSIVGFSNTSTPYSMVFTDKADFDQFTIKYAYRLKAGCSGFFFRSKETSSGAYVEGCQVEAKFQDGIQNQFGNIYCWPTNAWQTFTRQPFWQKAAKPNDEFQEVVLTVKRPYVYVNINGYQAVGAGPIGKSHGGVDAWDYTGTGTYSNRPGQFALQIHNGQSAMDVKFKDIAILEGCSNPSSPNYDGAFVAGLPEHPAVYQDNGSCNATSVEPERPADLLKYFGRFEQKGGKVELPVLYPESHTLEIVSLDGKVVFSGASPSARTYQFSAPQEAGVYVAKLGTKVGSNSKKIILR